MIKSQIVTHNLEIRIDGEMKQNMYQNSFQ